MWSVLPFFGGATAGSQAAQLAGQVEHAVTGLGVLLVLVTLFTAEQARLLQVERERSPEPKRTQCTMILMTCVALGVVTLVSFVALVGLADSAASDLKNLRDEPSLSVFVVTWLLLVPLAGWQLWLGVDAKNLRKTGK
jgi:hypothetical protein